MITLSIIVPVYNGENKITRCLKSIINQDYSDFEIIVIDDGSTDKTKEVVKELIVKEKRIRYFYQTNKGVSSARNFGIKVSLGSYITFIDVDDTYKKNALMDFFKYKKIYNSDIIRFNYYYSTSENKNESMGYSYDFSDCLIKKNSNILPVIIEQIITGKIQTFVWVLFIKKNILTDICFNEKIKFMEDKVFYIEVLKNAKTITFSNTVIYHYYYDKEFSHKNSDYYGSYLFNVNLVFNSINKLLYEMDYNYLMSHLHSWYINTVFNVCYLMSKNGTKWKKVIMYISKVQEFIKEENFNKPNEFSVKLKNILITRHKYLLLLYYYIRKGVK